MLKQIYFPIVKPQVHKVSASSCVAAIFLTETVRENRWVAQQSTLSERKKRQNMVIWVCNHKQQMICIDILRAGKEFPSGAYWQLP